MQKHFASVGAIGLFGFIAAADAQTSPSPTAGTQFDGTYAFVSSAKVNETWRDFHNREYPCGYYPKGGLLTIVNGHARYSVEGRGYYEGTVSSQGELAMHFAAPLKFGAVDERVIHGRIDGNGAVRARRMSRSCNHDMILQKQFN